MNLTVARLPLVGVVVYSTLCHLMPPGSLMGGLITILAGAALIPLLNPIWRRQLSPIDKTFILFLILAGLPWWVNTRHLGQIMYSSAMPVLYLLLLGMAVFPPVLLKTPYFTEFFARRRTPEAVQGTAIYKTINRHMTLVWAGIFAACFLISSVPNMGLSGPVFRIIFELVLPAALLLGFGRPFTMRYPDYYQRQMGLTPTGAPSGNLANKKEKTMAPSGAQAAKTCRELLEMMPIAFNAQAAGDMKATIQFEVSGEDFTAHLAIADGKCEFHSGPAASPDVTVKTPADIWLAISRGEKDGASAFMSGQFKAEGNLGILMQMNGLFSAA